METLLTVLRIESNLFHIFGIDQTKKTKRDIFKEMPIIQGIVLIFRPRQSYQTYIE